MAMVGGGGAMGAEESAAILDRAQKALPAAAILAGQFPDARHAGGELVMVRVGDLVGSQGGDHPAFPARGGDSLMVLETVNRMFGGGDHLDVETFEQSAWPEGRL